MGLANGDLTTFATAKGYIDKLPSDQVLSGLITRMSRMILTVLNRSIIVPHTYNEKFDGTGTTQLVLPHWPVNSFTSLIISGATIQPAPQENTNLNTFQTEYGYRILTSGSGAPPGQAAVLELSGGAYYYPGKQNVQASYLAGYQISGETQTIPNATPYVVAPNTPFGTWATDGGVTFGGSGTPLTPIAQGLVPSTGQYVPPKPDTINVIPNLNYTFSSADAGKTVLLTYGFVPADLEQAALEMIAERASYRSRVGIHSQSLAGQETFSYDLSGMPKWVVDAIWPYVSPLPPAIGAQV